ncbi:Wzz/FepE/Etk N-terminal domain-containing protein [Rheinheimera soli]|uniref:Wzz/FepE/Etk N-terminal domain-containing protein n=1 Tax=Rheinheimera soli TaxID=443616 RepID=UPI001E3FE704|nr:Wzz/FepE/Etk N-terminal domain-containing protein [Rheinheimera soli]
MDKDNFNELHTGNIISVSDIVSHIWRGKWIIGSVTSIFSIAFILYALSLPNIYRSEALLAPVTASAGMEIPGQLGGLAAIAGINLNGLGSGKNNTVLALEIIKSRDFISQFIEKNNILVQLMAVDGWDMYSNELIIDSNVYDSSNNEWKRKVKLPFKPKPSLLEAHESFIDILNVSRDKTTDIVKISIDHYSPYIAEKWLKLLIHDINDEMRRRDIYDSTASINYLQAQLNKTNVTGIQAALYSLIEEQTKTLMLANVKEEYVFITIDPPVAPENRVSPRRSLIAIIGFIFGLTFSLLSLMALNTYRNTHRNRT